MNFGFFWKFLKKNFENFENFFQNMQEKKFHCPPKKSGPPLLILKPLGAAFGGPSGFSEVSLISKYVPDRNVELSITVLKKNRGAAIAP